MKAIVIGGGIAGLAAALELQRQGHEPHVLEASPLFGGQVRTFYPAGEAGERLEIFYHHLFRSDFAMLRVLEELGLTDALQWLPSNVGMLAGGELHPFNGPFDLLRFGPVSPLARLRLGLAAMWLRRTADWHGYEHQPAGPWLARAVGEDAYARVWEPLLRAKFGRHADQVSLAWFWGKMYLRFASRDDGLFARERLGYLRGSFGRVIEAMVDAVRERGGVAEHSTPVRRVLIENGRARGVLVGEGPAGDGEGERRIEGDAVLATVPSGLFAQMVPELDPARAEQLRAMRYQWASVVVLALDRPLSPYYWLTVTEPDCPFVLAVEHTNLVPPSDYGGRHIVYLSRYADPGDPLLSEELETLLERYEPWLRRINPDFERSWLVDSWVFRDRAGQPVVDTAYGEAIPPMDTGIGGLYLANTTQIYPQDRGQNYSIMLGERVAQLAIARHVHEGAVARSG